MPKRKKDKGRDALQLQDRLVLASWFASQLGFGGDLKYMLACAKECGDTAEHSGSTIVRLISSRQNCKIPQATLAEMDDAIREDLASINRRRSPPVKLKYFQYLAALSAEWFLRRRKESADDLAADISDFAKSANLFAAVPRFSPCQPSQLSKLAFWMATGSGKTLLMHLNYRQCLRHLPFAPGNILLITPNADMTKQHLEELRTSGIPCYRHGESGGGFLAGNDNSVCVLDIHKLSDKPGKQSDTVKPSFFEGPNLVFVDEGHKGAGGEDAGYFNKRDKLVEGGGFAMEYSATFGQAFARLPNRAEEYGRAIAFDYSYRYFYEDGYGKDFFILNTDGDAEYNQDNMLLGNLLSFCQQRLVYDKHPQTMEKHNIAAPLLLMLGAHVVGEKGGQSGNQQQTQTDIVRIVDFLRRVATDNKWLRQKTAAIINGESGMSEDGKDIFDDKFDFLRQCFGEDIDALCAAVREKVFHAKAPGALCFSVLKKTDGGGGKFEISLRVADNKPFALVYVGNARKLREITERDAPKVKTGEDLLQESLFASINEEESPVNILIGAKKFMEGWSSWRVCGIGLLNVGRGEGPLIIQLFGRGVRLRGLGFSLKRSAGKKPGDSEGESLLPLLETLNIFAVRAGFMHNFRDYLRREGVIHKIIDVPVQQMEPMPKDLPVPKMPPEREFNEWCMLGDDDKAEINIDLSSAITIGRGGNNDMQAATMAAATCHFDKKVCRRINFGNLHLRLLEEQNNGGIGNIVITPDRLQTTLAQCSVKTDKNDPLKNFNHARLQQTAFAALRQAAKKQHARKFRQWQKQHIGADKLGNKRDNIIAKYRLHLPSDQAALINEVRRIIAAGEQTLHGENSKHLPRLFYESHLYNPLLLESAFKTEPPGLVQSERDFINALRAHVAVKPPKDADICLLRNLPNAGIGFPLDDGKMFYPDFILWIKRGGKTRVVFIEPHGMLLSPAHKHNHKAHLGKFLRGLSLPFELDACIISETDYGDLRQHYDDGNWTTEQFAENDILFMEHLQNEETREAAFAKLLNIPE